MENILFAECVGVYRMLLGSDVVYAIYKMSICNLYHFLMTNMFFSSIVSFVY